jgi:hypothetical protein
MHLLTRIDTALCYTTCVKIVRMVRRLQRILLGVSSLDPIECSGEAENAHER